MLPVNNEHCHATTSYTGHGDDFESIQRMHARYHAYVVGKTTKTLAVIVLGISATLLLARWVYDRL